MNLSEDEQIQMVKDIATIKANTAGLPVLAAQVAQNAEDIATAHGQIRLGKWLLGGAGSVFLAIIGALFSGRM